MSGPQKSAGTVNRYLLARLRGSPDSLYVAASHLIRNGGKRLRPYMVLKSCQLLGGKPADAMPAAAAVEMIHNFSLVHDDIMDNDEVRHGVPTTHSKFGVPLAILAGDVLFSKAYQVIASLAPQDMAAELMGRLAGGCVDICEGQQLDIAMSQSSRIPSQREYVRMISKKTAALFDVSCSMGAICAGAGRDDISNMSAFGKNLGITFQITDDLIGVMGDPSLTKKPVGNDLREGKKSLPILAAIDGAAGDDRDAILKCFGNPGATKEDLDAAVSVIRDLGIEDAVRLRSNRYAKRARTRLGAYSGAAKDELESLLDFVVKRSL